MSDPAASITGSSEVSGAAQANQAEAATTQAIKGEAQPMGDLSTEVSSIEEFRNKFPEMYDKFEQMIIRRMLRDVESFRDRLKRARRG